MRRCIPWDTICPCPLGTARLCACVERQPGYKMAKYIKRIVLVSGYANIGEGNGCYWADRGYEWYAGIGGIDFARSISRFAISPFR
jgi:DMSO/TMAO reductase YedYZ molybdopterin-dependent catalytic subunit